jgi:hypothetical protein
VTVFSVLLIVSAFFGALYFWSSGPRVAAGFQAFKNHYLAIMTNLNSSKTKLAIASDLDDVHNFTDVFAWEHTKLMFGSDPNGWFEDPSQILTEGGRRLCSVQHRFRLCMLVARR